MSYVIASFLYEQNSDTFILHVIFDPEELSFSSESSITISSRTHFDLSKMRKVNETASI